MPRLALNRPANLNADHPAKGAAWAPVLTWALGLALVSFAGQPLAAAEAPAQAYAFTSFSIEAGLPSDVVMPIVQTRDGYLWFGTESGLCRFDGARFEVYRAA